jgi:hypothetical protein
MSRLLLVLLLATLSGCASRKNPFNEWFASETYEDYVPKTALPVVQGKGVLTYQPTERGTIYVLDTSNMIHVKDTITPHLLGSGFAMKGATMQFDPSTGIVSSNGKTDFKIQDVLPDHMFELRFDPVKKVEKK